MKKGLLIILSGPSGVGKGTVRKYIFSHTDIPLFYSVSMTTRCARNSEVDGVDYYFVSEEKFKENINSDNLLEYARFVGNYYGTPKDKVEEMRNSGKNVFLEIEINGATQVLDKCRNDSGLISFFLMPPSIEDLRARITNRKTESEEIINERLNKGIKEMNYASSYDYTIINDDVTRAGEEIIALIKSKYSSGK